MNLKQFTNFALGIDTSSKCANGFYSGMYHKYIWVGYYNSPYLFLILILQDVLLIGSQLIQMLL